MTGMTGCARASIDMMVALHRQFVHRPLARGAAARRGSPLATAGNADGSGAGGGEALINSAEWRSLLRGNA